MKSFRAPAGRVASIVFAALLAIATWAAADAPVAWAAREHSTAPSNSPPREPGGKPMSSPSFTWPASVSVPVVERVLKNGHTGENAYSLRTCSTGRNRLRVEHADFRLVSLDGVLASDPRLVPVVKQLTPLYAAIPAFFIDSSGAAVDIESTQKMIDSLAKVFPERDYTPLRKSLESEHATAVLKEAVLDRWRSWVELWLNYDPRLGAVMDLTSYRAGVTNTFTVSFDGWSGDRARLAMHSKFSDDQMKKMMGSVFTALGIKDLDTRMVEKAHGGLSWRIETSWPDIRPHSVTTEKTFSITIEGKTDERVERHEYRFDWANAKRVSCPASAP